MTFDMGSVPAARRLGAWTETLYETYYPLDLENPATSFEKGRLDLADLEGVRLGRILSDPMIVHRRRRHTSRSGGDFYFLPMPLERPIRVSQGLRERLVAPGDFGLIATADTYTYEQRTENRLLTLRIDGPLLRARLPLIDDFAGSCFEGRRAAVNLFVDMASSLIRNAPQLEPECAGLVAQQLLDLLALALGAPDDAHASSESSVRAAHRRRITRMIELKLQDLSLTPRMIGEKLGLSERYIQKIFAERGETLTGVIRSRRIAAARRYLADPTRKGQSVAAIGFSVGYADPAHFSRVFRSEMGMSPRDYRAQSLTRPENY